MSAAEEVCEADLDAPRGTRRLSLLRPIGNDRFFMLETIREYALDGSKPRSRRGAPRAPRAEFTELAERARRELRRVGAGALGGAARDRASEHPGGARLGERARPELLHRMARSLRIFWNTHGYLREGRSWLERSLGTGAEGIERAEILGGLGWICRAMGDWEAAAEAAKERLQLAQALDDPKNLNAALGLQAVLAEEGGTSTAPRSFTR